MQLQLKYLLITFFLSTFVAYMLNWTSAHSVFNKISRASITSLNTAYIQLNKMSQSAIPSQSHAPPQYGMDKIPDGFIAYKRTPLFTSENVPKSLLHRHNTKGGSWGKIIVSKGSLEYLIFGPPERVFTLTPDVPGIIKSMEYHKVKLLSPDTEFHVEFYAANPDEAQPPRHVPTTDIN